MSGLDGVMFNDLMENIEWFFNLHDKNKDGFLTKDEVLTLSESMLVRSNSIGFIHLTSFNSDFVSVYIQVRDWRCVSWCYQSIHVERFRIRGCSAS